MATKSKFFCLLLNAGTFTSVSKDSKSLRVHKTVEIKVFLNFSLVYGRIPDADLDTDPEPDPDLENWPKTLQ